MVKWIKTSDKKPEYKKGSHNQIVIHVRNCPLGIATINEDLRDDNIVYDNEWSIQYSADDFVYWLPIPELPDDEDN